MIKSPLSPDPVVTTALRVMLQDAVWAASFERICDSGIDALGVKAARYAKGLAARGPDLDAPVEAVTVALYAAARELYPDSPAAAHALAIASAVPAAVAAEVDTVPEERWSPEWADRVMARALRRLAQEYPEGADVPDLDAETDEIYVASDAEDRERYRRAVDAWLESALRMSSVRDGPGYGKPGRTPVSASQPPWDEDWAAAEYARALTYIGSRVQSGDDPEAREEWREFIAAQTARDAPRFSKALRAAVQASLKELAREGRLLPEPKVEPTRTPLESASPFKIDPPGSSAKNAWGARSTYRNQRINR